MEKLLAMSIFTSAADPYADLKAAQSWVKSWMARKTADGTTSCGGKTQPADASSSSPEKKADERRPQRVRAPHFAVEFDGLNCFETFVSH